MKLKINVAMAGDRFSWTPGQVVSIADAEECFRLVEAGHAEYVEERDARKAGAEATEEADATDDATPSARKRRKA